MLITIAASCSSSTSSSGSSIICASSYPEPSGGTATPTGSNVMSVTVDGSLCSAAYQYQNEPCGSVTICQPGTATCQTINNILIDTGSFGLRVFSSLITVSLTQVMSGGQSVAECAEFGTGADWGPVKLADLKLAGEATISNIPIQVIDSTFGTVPTSCNTPTPVDTSPQQAGYNGILGVGLFAQDCGNYCVTHANSGSYYGCTGSSCSGVTLSLANQVQNPVPLLATDNNGVVLNFPSVPAGGSPSVNGYLTFGIGTQSNNTPTGVSAYKANGSGEFSTALNGATYSGFIDSGSNGIFFQSTYSNLPTCSDGSSFYCPSCSTNLTATNTGISGSSTGNVTFQVANLNTLSASNYVFSNTAGELQGAVDFGLSFFYGRTVYVGVQGATSSLGTGPYWAY